jgi:hypothetical protein
VYGFNPHGNQSTREFFAKQFGEYDPIEAIRAPQLIANDMKGFKIPWDLIHRSGDSIEEGNENQEKKSPAELVKDFFDYYEVEFKAADLYSGTSESTKVFTIMFNYMKTHEKLDTIMAHSTGAKALISFFDVVASYVFGEEARQIPDELKDQMHEMEENGLDFQKFLLETFDHIKVIQFVRGNTDMSDITNMHPKLREILMINDVSIINYYHPKDMVLGAAQLHDRIYRLLGKSKGPKYEPIGKTKIPSHIENGKRLAISNIKLQKGGIDGHNLAIDDIDTMAEVLEHRTYLLDKKSSVELPEMPSAA